MSGFNALSLDFILKESRTRWLKGYEILTILQDYDAFGLQVSTVPSHNPLSGSLFLFSKKLKFRQDGIEWKKGKEGKVKESHEKLKVAGRDALQCVYSTSERSNTFQRRIYWSLTPSDPQNVIVLVHYLDSDIAKEQIAAEKDLKLNKSQDEIVNSFLNQIESPLVGEFEISEMEGTVDPLSLPNSNYYFGTSFAARTLPRITDFSPEWDYLEGGAKILVTGVDFKAGFHQYYCLFDDVEVPAVLIQEGVLRCNAPPRDTPGKVVFGVTMGDFTPFSELQHFEYRMKSSQSDWLSGRENIKNRIIERLESIEKKVIQGRVDNSISFGNQSTDQSEQNLYNRYLKLLLKLVPEESNQNSFPEPTITPEVLVNSSDSEGFTLLHCACACGYYNMALILLANGANVNVRDTRGITPFHQALKSGNRSLTNLLLPYVEDDILTSESELDDEERTFLDDVQFSEEFEHMSLDEISVVATRFIRESKQRNGPMQSKAAARIQAAYRSYKARQQKGKEEVSSESEMEEIRKKEQEIQAAIKIQIAYRNHRQKPREKVTVKVQSRVQQSAQQKELRKKENDAAKKIQRAFFRYKGKNSVDSENYQ